MNFKEFRTDLNKAMETLGKKYNITLTAGNISYDNTTFTVKVNGKRDDVDVDKERFMEMLGYMQYYGFNKDDYKKDFEMRGRRYFLFFFVYKLDNFVFLINIHQYIPYKMKENYFLMNNLLDLLIYLNSMNILNHINYYFLLHHLDYSN